MYLLYTLKEWLGVYWKDWCWSWNSNTLATWCEELTHLKRLLCKERLRTGGEGDNRGWDGWMALTTQWICIWIDSGSWWWAGRPVCCSSWGHKESDTAEWLNYTELKWISTKIHEIKLLNGVSPCRCFKGVHCQCNQTRLQRSGTCKWEEGYMREEDQTLKKVYKVGEFYLFLDPS